MLFVGFIAINVGALVAPNVHCYYFGGCNQTNQLHSLAGVPAEGNNQCVCDLYEI